MVDASLGEVVSLDLYSIGVYASQKKMSFRANYSEETADDLADATDNFKHFSGSRFFGTAAKILELDDEQLDSFIENGWDEPRLRFVLELANPVNTRGKELRTILTGFIDSVDSFDMHDGVLSDDAQFYINNVVQYTVDSARGATSQRVYNGKVINPASSNQGSSVNSRTVNQVNANAVRAITVLGVEEFLDEGEEVQMLELNPPGSVLVSGRQGNNSNYIDDAVRAINVSARSIMNGPVPMASRGFSQLNEDIIEEATGHLEQKGLTSVPLLMELHSINEAFLEDNSFFMSDLASIFPDIDAVTEPFFIDPEELSAVEDSEILDDSAEAEIALILAMILPSETFEHLIGICEIAIDTLNEELVAILSSKALRPDHQNLALEEDFIFKTERNLGRLVDDWEERYGDIFAHVVIDSLGESVITVSLDGQQDCTYRIPQFADNAFSPLLTQSFDNTLLISNMLRQVAGAAYETRYDEEIPYEMN